jgi:predicted metal-dependent HD superfamily phosphohydrolase
MKRVYIVGNRIKERENDIKKGIRPEYNWLDETDFTDELDKKLLEKNNIIFIKKKRK